MRQAEIRLFLREYSDGNYSEYDHGRFIEWLNSAPVQDIEEIIEEYRMIIENKPSSKDSSARIIALVESALNRRDAGVSSPKYIRTKTFSLRRAGRIGVAAALAALIIGALGYWLLNKRSPVARNGKIAASGMQDVQAPKSTKARIILSNGQAIYLDSVDNGVLAKQGNVRILKAGKTGIVYNSISQLKSDKVKYNTLYNPRGSMVVSLSLSDGTKVWLNAASSLRYPVSFSGHERKVSITGEAYFEVAKNPDKMFLVDAGGVVTEVLGTHFNVNAYPDEGRTVVTLLEGAVRVKKTGSSAVIQPGQQAVVTRGVRIVSNADLQSVMAWKNGEFIMKSINIGNIMRQVSRWYDVDVAYEAAIPDIKISGEVSRNLNLSQMLKVLKYSGVHVKLEGRRVIIMP